MASSRFGKVAFVALVISLCAAAAAASNWGPASAYSCKAIGVRTYGAVLWNIPLGKDWNKECSTTPVGAINGQPVNRPPDRCSKHADGHEWGEWDLPDSACPHWGSFDTDGCSQDPNGVVGLHVYAVVWDIPVGLSWDSVCHSMSADTILGYPAGRHPDKCDEHEGHEWGEYWLEDTAAEWECFSHAIEIGAGG